MKTQTNKLLTLVAGAALFVSSNVQAQLFIDPFTTDTSANWTIRAASVTAVDDYTAQFGFYYATNTFVRNGVTNTIPLAPNSTIGVATNGVKVTVNKNDATPDASGVNLYPVGQSFSNDYALKFDMWINYNGGEFGGTGSTEFGIWGINMSGNNTNWAATGSVEIGDGVWYGVTGEGGAARDWRSYVGDALIPGVPLELQGVSGGFFDRDFDTIVEQESFTDPESAPLKLMFPKPTYETAAVPGKQWVQVEVRQRTNSLGSHEVTWLMNGQIIATNTFDPFLQTNGNIMIGAMDPFASIASPAADNFVIFDNVRVIDLSGVAAPETLIIQAADATATEPSGDDGQMVITRSGSTASPLTVPISVSSFAGTATRNVDYQIRTNGVSIGAANSVVIPAGSSTLALDIVVINDTIGEASENVYVTLVGNPNAYDLGYSNYAVVTIADDSDLPTTTVTTFRRAAYEGNTNSYGLFRIDFSSAYTLSDLTVNYTLAGTAANGTHYTTTNTTSVTMVAGSTNAFVPILAQQNADSVSNRTVILTLAPGANYLINTNGGATNGTVTIFNDDLPTPVATAFADDFDVDSSANWNVNLGTAPVRDRATFAYDYSVDGIPSAPRSVGSSTKALKLEANVNTLAVGLFSGLSASPIGGNFTGDFRLRFDWWGNYNQPNGGGSGTTQLGTFGITRGGTFPQWPGTGSPASKDSIYFGMSLEGGTNPDYRAYTNGGTVLPAAAFLTAGDGNNTASYYNIFGNLEAPVAQLSAPIYGANQVGRTPVGAPGLVWHEVVVTKIGSTLTWHVDGVLLGTVNANRVGYSLSTNIFVGMTDINNGQAAISEAQFTLVDNLLVETLPAPAVNITNIVVIGNNRVLTFTGGTSDPAAAYVLQQAPVVTGPYTNNLTASITNNAPGVFTAITTNTAAAQFYRILR